MGTPSPDDITVPALAAQVADLRGQLRTIKARVEAAGMVGGGVRLHEQVAEIARALAELQDEGKLPAASAPTWTGLDDSERQAQLAELAEWVTGFLAVNYPHVMLRLCWPQHPAAVWELSTLRAEWRRIYDRKRPELAGALAFHDRWLPGVADRLETILKDCKGTCALISPVQPRRPLRAG